MVSFRSAAAALILAAASAAVVTPPAAAPGVATMLSGFVRDEVGGALEGVEILVLSPEGRGDGALLRAVTDAGGRFLLGSIPPGVYRVAAIKSGYVATFGRVNTVLRSSVDLVLRPVPKNGETGSEKVLDDLSWTLRVPPQSILRELDESAIVASSGGSSGARTFAARVQDSVRGEVDHMVALGSWRPGSSGPSSNLEGNRRACGSEATWESAGRSKSVDVVEASIRLRPGRRRAPSAAGRRMSMSMCPTTPPPTKAWR